MEHWLGQRILFKLSVHAWTHSKKLPYLNSNIPFSFCICFTFVFYFFSSANFSSGSLLVNISLIDITEVCQCNNSICLSDTFSPTPPPTRSNGVIGSLAPSLAIPQ